MEARSRGLLVLFANRIVPCQLLSVEFSVDRWTSEVEAAVCPGHNPAPGLVANRSSLPSAALTASSSLCHRVLELYIYDLANFLFY
jgi:hypothetical protein